MKYLITESQLDRVIFKYLNNRGMIQIKRTNGIYFTDSEDDEFAQIRYNKKNGFCQIDFKLIEDVSLLFSLGVVDSKTSIGKWVENTIQMDVEYAQWVVFDKSVFLSIPPN
jgi:hypothetical protein